MLQKGFTLIELMIVVAIIGILSMFALPAYQDYTKRTYVAEGMGLASAAKMAASEYYASEAKWPSNNDQAGLPAAKDIKGQSVVGVGIGSGGDDPSTIVIYYGQKVTGEDDDTAAKKAPANATTTAAATAGSLTLIGDATSGSVTWRCSTYNNDGNEPADKAVGVKSKWLPSNCRAQIQDKGAGTGTGAGTTPPGTGKS